MLAAVIGIAMTTAVDVRISDAIFAAGGGAWPLPHAGWTRALGYEGPKGMYPVTPIRRASLWRPPPVGYVAPSPSIHPMEQTMRTAFSDERYESAAMSANTPHVGFDQNGCHQLCLLISSAHGLQQCFDCLDQLTGNNSQS